MSMNTNRPDASNGGAGKTSGEAGMLQNAADQVSDVARSAVDQGSALVGGMVDATGDIYSQSSRAVGRQVRDRPLTALIVAGAVGYGIAWLFHTGHIPTAGIRRTIRNFGGGHDGGDGRHVERHNRHRSGGR